MNTVCVLVTVVGLALGEKDVTRWDFEDAAVGKLPAGWTEAQTGKGKGSVWKIVEDKTSPKGPKALAQTSPDGPGPMFNLCVADKSNFKDLDLSVSFKALAGEVDQGGGPVWRYKDSNNYYVARFNPLENNYRVYKVIEGKRAQLATASVKVESGKWHTIRVVHKGDQIECYLNGKKLLEAKDDALQAAGKIGLWTKADAQTAFDDLVIRKAE
jgi:hypothetical protein